MPEGGLGALKARPVPWASPKLSGPQAIAALHASGGQARLAPHRRRTGPTCRIPRRCGGGRPKSIPRPRASSHVSRRTTLLVSPYPRNGRKPYSV